MASYARVTGENIAVDVSNGVTLCEACHQKTFGCEEELASMFEALGLRKYNFPVSDPKGLEDP